MGTRRIWGQVCLRNGGCRQIDRGGDFLGLAKIRNAAVGRCSRPKSREREWGRWIRIDVDAFQIVLRGIYGKERGGFEARPRRRFGFYEGENENIVWHLRASFWKQRRRYALG